MECYKFTTTISEDGKIEVPDNPSLFNKEVDITIIPKQAVEAKKRTASDFVKKWTGVLSENGVEDAKYQYLSEKYK